MQFFVQKITWRSKFLKEKFMMEFRLYAAIQTKVKINSGIWFHVLIPNSKEKMPFISEALMGKPLMFWKERPSTIKKFFNGPTSVKRIKSGLLNQFGDNLYGKSFKVLWNWVQLSDNNKNKIKFFYFLLASTDYLILFYNN